MARAVRGMRARGEGREARGEGRGEGLALRKSVARGFAGARAATGGALARLGSQDDQIDYNEISAVMQCEDVLEFAALLPKKKAESQKTNILGRKVGKRGLTAADILECQSKIKEKLRMLGGGGNNAVAAIKSYLDKDGSGSVILRTPTLGPAVNPEPRRPMRISYLDKRMALARAAPNANGRAASRQLPPCRGLRAPPTSAPSPTLTP